MKTEPPIHCNEEWLSHVESVATMDDWYDRLVGSDIRMVVSLVRRYQAAMNMGEGLSNSMVESGESHECAVSIPASGVDTSPATNTPKPLPEQIASEYAEPETTGEAGGRTSVERSGGISLVDEQMIELSKWLSKAMGSGEPWEWVDKAKQLLAIIDPFLRTDKPVSLEVCAQALFNDFADEDFGICKREAKVVLTAAGVPFTDEGGE